MKAHLCGYPGCNKLTSRYYCERHQKQADQKRKETAFRNATRYADYSSPEWRALRSTLLREHPYCSKCGASRDATKLHVHHIVPVRDDPARFLDKTNLVVLCECCHAQQTQIEILKRRSVR